MVTSLTENFGIKKKELKRLENYSCACSDNFKPDYVAGTAGFQVCLPFLTVLNIQHGLKALNRKRTSLVEFLGPKLLECVTANTFLVIQE